MTRASLDVVVVGAGVAGLAAARRLREAGLRIRVLEARDRIGGRILTRRVPGLPIPVELGAEFLHGAAGETTELVDRAGLLAVEIEGARIDARDGRLRRLDDFWDRIGAVLGRLDTERDPDRSLHAALADRPGGRPLARERVLAREFVEGFHAADARRVSERAIAEGGNPAESEEERRMARLADGYDRVPERLARGLGAALRLRTVVRRVEWRRGHVRVEADAPGGPTAVSARAAIVSVPLGVLLAPAGERGAIAFDPEPERALEAATGMAMGHVSRIALRFRARFWEEDLVDRLPEGVAPGALAFVHTRDEHFPVWWTAYPARAPLLVGWAGGPRAEAHAGRPKEELERLALDTLARQLALPRRRLSSLLEGSWTHDWSRDPFSRGAYSYSLVGGADAPERLARPVEGTLFFAGEAADAEGATGTVNGAIASGRAAAGRALRAL